MGTASAQGHPRVREEDQLRRSLGAAVHVCAEDGEQRPLETTPYEFPAAVRTKYPKRTAKNNGNLLSHVLEAKSLKSRLQQGHDPSKGFREESFLDSSSLQVGAGNLTVP